MKLKFPLLLAIPILLSACSEQFEEQPSIQQSIFKSYQTHRTEENVRKLAILAKNHSFTTRGKECKIKYVAPILNKRTRSGNDTVMYAVDFEGNNGFALISARRDVEPLLALIDSGSFADTYDLKEPYLQAVIKSAIEYASHPSPLLDLDTTPSFSPLPGFYDTIMPRTRKEPLVKVKWGQHYPEGMLCPNKIAGCGPVAALQILSTIKLPETMTYSYPNADKSFEAIDWNELLNHEKSAYSATHLTSETCLASAEAHYTLGRIARQIGHLSYAVYEPSFTSTIYPNVIAQIKNLTGKEVKNEGSSPLTLYNYIMSNKNSQIAYVRGTSTVDEYGSPTDNGAGHAWVADGAWEVGVKIIYTGQGAVTNPDLPPTLISKVIRDYSKYLHFNWGWNGMCNGYFLVNIFDPSQAYLYDDTGIWNYSDPADFAKDFKFFLFDTSN